jgi:anti-sigma factor RsiW
VSDPIKSSPCDFESELPLLLYQGELERDERERLRAHLATCPRCEEAFAQLEATAIALDGAMAVPKPSSEQWRKLKENVLSRVAGNPVAGGDQGAGGREAPRAAGPAERDAPPTATGGAGARDVAAALDEPCEGVEEDLLVLNELPTDRKRAVLAHLDACGSCRDTRSAFGSIGIVLNRQPLEWPSIERWDSIKETVLSQVQSETKRTTQTIKVATLDTRRFRSGSWSTYLRIAAAIAIVAGASAAFGYLRGPTADDVRRQWLEAQGGGTLAIVTNGYEQVVKKGLDLPECRYEVDDALAQLQAIRKFQVAYEQSNPEVKRVQLVDIIVRYPTVRVAKLALDEYNKLPRLQATPGVNVRVTVPNGGGFKTPFPQLPFQLDTGEFERRNANLESEIASLADIADENLHKKRENEIKQAMAVNLLQWGQSEHADMDAAVQHYKKALELAEPDSPTALEAQKYVNGLAAGH